MQKKVLSPYALSSQLRQKKSFENLKKALLKESNKGKNQKTKEPPCTWVNSLKVPDPEILVNAPHIYLALAYLDAFNHNVDRTISLLKSASQRFSNHAPVVSFNINFALALFLEQEDKHDRKKHFPILR